MPISTNCFCIIGFAGLMAGAGCTSTTPTNQSASLAPTETVSVVASSGLPDSMEVASVARDAAESNAAEQGTVISAVAYASPAPGSSSLVALNNAVVAGGDPEPEAGAEVGGATAAVPVEGVQQAASIPAAPVQMAARDRASATEERTASSDSVQAVVPASPEPTTSSNTVEARSPELDSLIDRYAKIYEVPVALVRRVVKRESTFNPAARNGPYWGLMQIRHDTAKGMGYKGTAQGLLNAETNLTYAVKYLKGAYITASGDHDQAVRYYSRGYYYDAKRRGLLEATGLKPGQSAAAVQVAAQDSAERKAAEMDRGARLAVQSLPGVSTANNSVAGPLPAPSSARMTGSGPAAATSGPLALSE